MSLNMLVIEMDTIKSALQILLSTAWSLMLLSSRHLYGSYKLNHYRNKTNVHPLYIANPTEVVKSRQHTSTIEMCCRKFNAQEKHDMIKVSLSAYVQTIVGNLPALATG